MGTRWNTSTLFALAAAAALAGCTANDPQDRGAVGETGPKSADARPVVLRGCVGTGPGTQQYFLTQVQLAPRDEQRTDAQTSLGTSITEHSQLRLSMGDADQLRQHVGKIVQLEGAIRDDGRNTIATTGTPEGKSASDPEPRTDQSQAASKQGHSEKVREEMGPMGNRSLNNGTFPEVVVQRIESSGQQCNQK